MHEYAVHSAVRLPELPIYVVLLDILKADSKNNAVSKKKHILNSYSKWCDSVFIWKKVQS